MIVLNLHFQWMQGTHAYTCLNSIQLSFPDQASPAQSIPAAVGAPCMPNNMQIFYVRTKVKVLKEPKHKQPRNSKIRTTERMEQKNQCRILRKPLQRSQAMRSVGVRRGEGLWWWASRAIKPRWLRANEFVCKSASGAQATLSCSICDLDLDYGLAPWLLTLYTILMTARVHAIYDIISVQAGAERLPADN